MGDLPVDRLDQATFEINVDQTANAVLIAADATSSPSPADLLLGAVIEVVDSVQLG